MTYTKQGAGADLPGDVVATRLHHAYYGPLFEELKAEQPNRIPLSDHEAQNSRVFTVVSMFSGAGGMDLGFRGDFTFLGKHYERNPYKIVWALTTGTKVEDNG